MAMTALLYLNQSSVTPGTPVTATVVVSNSGAAPVSVTSFLPQVSPLGSSALCGTPTPAVPKSVPAGGSASFSFPVCGFAAQAPGYPQGAYEVSAALAFSDGTVATSSAATVQVASPFDPVPSEGGFRFDSNLNSYAVALL
jgi:hypothetical protein